MTNLTDEQRLRILRAQETARCFCGAKKRPGAFFCPRHFSQLTPAMRASLSRSTGEAYITSYTAAREWLKERAHPAVTRVE